MKVIVRGGQLLLFLLHRDTADSILKWTRQLTRLFSLWMNRGLVMWKKPGIYYHPKNIRETDLYRGVSMGGNFIPHDAKSQKACFRDDFLQQQTIQNMEWPALSLEPE
ncbi:hypothetical protein CEXT_454451 [Caerostris extrusa]|uniref:Uncharacterized protein n=1 Tax=Caerostris extrusa TaxID=172846 RepID=A0AAV4QSF6_CAEEX|nr:hypothetical protein CEXT_454451 [Caerostris extrusa]